VAIRFIDSVGHYTSAQAPRKWTLIGGQTVTTSGGRRNAPYIQFSGGGGASKTLTYGTRWIQGCAMQMQPGAGNLGGNILSLTADNTELLSLFMNNDATLSIRVGGTQTGLSTIAVADPTSWHYYEMDGTLSASGGNVAGTASIKVDGNSYGIFGGVSGIGTAGLIFGSSAANGVGVKSVAASGFMDYYCLDTSTTDINGINGSTNTTFLGDVEIDALFPSADVTTGWGTVGGDGTHAYTCVNETHADDDTSYVFTTASGSIESFNYQPITGFTGTLLAAQYLACARKDAEGSRIITLPVGTGSNLGTSVEFLQANNYLSDFYVYYIAPLDTDFGTAWTTAVFNAERFGVKLVG
jgi:hypothetical protein